MEEPLRHQKSTPPLNGTDLQITINVSKTSKSSASKTMAENKLATPKAPVANIESSQKTVETGEDLNGSTSGLSDDEKRRFTQIRDSDTFRKIWNVVSWTPKRCRWDPESPPKFSMGLNLLFGFVSGVFSGQTLVNQEATSVKRRLEDREK